MTQDKRLLISLLFIIGIVILGTMALMQSLEGNRRTLTEMPIEEVDISQIPYGTYFGRYQMFPVSVQVELDIREHIITRIILVEHSNGKGGKAEVIPSAVVKRQSLQVDSVSGATYSSRVILKAIEDALINAQ